MNRRKQAQIAQAMKSRTEMMKQACRKKLEKKADRRKEA